MNNKLLKLITKPITNDYDSYYGRIKELTKSIKSNQLSLIKFTYSINEGLDQHYDCEKYPKIYNSRQDCLKLVKDVIDNPELLNCDKHKEKLRNAAYAANAAADAAADAAAYAAAYDANDAAAADAAYAAAYDANAAAAYDANAAAYDANAAVDTAADAAAYAAAYDANDAAYATYAAARLQKIKEFYYNLCCLIIEEYELCDVKKFKLLFKGN